MSVSVARWCNHKTHVSQTYTVTKKKYERQNLMFLGHNLGTKVHLMAIYHFRFEIERISKLQSWQKLLWTAHTDLKLHASCYKFVKKIPTLPSSP